MKKIPTLFQRDPDDRRHVLPIVTPGCEWVLAGEGVATRKYDGTCVMFDGGRWWARREVKPGKADPPDFDLVNIDEVTGKRMGWEPMENTGWAKFHAEALDSLEPLEVGTYELCGPKVNGNPEGSDVHRLVSHDHAFAIDPLPPDELIAACRHNGWEGIVWHHPDGRMVKLKVKDFPS